MTSIVLKDGKIYEYNGELLTAFYGNGFVAVDTDGKIVAALDENGTIHEFRNRQEVKTYGKDLLNVHVRNGRVFGTDKLGYNHEYVNGVKRVSFYFKK